MEGSIWVLISGRVQPGSTSYLRDLPPPSLSSSSLDSSSLSGSRAARLVCLLRNSFSTLSFFFFYRSTFSKLSSRKLKNTNIPFPFQILRPIDMCRGSCAVRGDVVVIESSELFWGHCLRRQAQDRRYALALLNEAMRVIR